MVHSLAVNKIQQTQLRVVAFGMGGIHIVLASCSITLELFPPTHMSSKLQQNKITPLDWKNGDPRLRSATERYGVYKTLWWYTGVQ